MGTSYVTCPNCSALNTGQYPTCMRCRAMMPINPMPMQQNPPRHPVRKNILGAGNYPSQLDFLAKLQIGVGLFEAIGGTLGGIIGLIIGFLSFGIGLLAIPIPIIFFIVGCVSIVSGIKGINKNPSYGLSLIVSIAQMLLIFCFCDVISFIAGLTGIILLMRDEVKEYFT